MKVLHVTPHLGGGVGKAHAAIRGALPKDVDQTFVLLEAPRDRRYADMIAAGGARIVIASRLDEISALARLADIVQFEFWNHPRLFECLARCGFPAIRSMFWSHISGLSRPVIQPGLVEQAGRFVLSTEASRSAPFTATLSESARPNIAVINSGFGFAEASTRPLLRSGTPAIAYLGTVDFIKMHPGFFAAIDRLDGGDVRASVWGSFDPAGPVFERVRAMRHPGRVVLRGQTTKPATALSEAEIFFYPLQADHYGTSENALVEAMSLGLVPVVLNNPAEMAIVRHAETGFVANSVEECAELLQMLLSSSPETRQRISSSAARHIAQTRTPARSAREFVRLWQGLLDEPKRATDFRAVIGDSPADWFLATQCLPGTTWSPSASDQSKAASKGMLAHFRSVFPDDVSLSLIAGG